MQVNPIGTVNFFENNEGGSITWTGGKVIISTDLDNYRHGPFELYLEDDSGRCQLKMRDLASNATYWQTNTEIIGKPPFQLIVAVGILF